MVTYEDVSIMPYRHVALSEHCAMCGCCLRKVINSADCNEYHFCVKCKTIKFWVEII